MINFLKITFAAMIVFTLVMMPSLSYAGDIVPAGTTLEQESYVFTIDEATRLLQRVEELGLKERQLELYIALESLRSRQIGLYEYNLELSRTQLNNYRDMQALDQNLIDRYNKRSRFQTLENVGFLSLGIALTIGAFLAADSVTDHMEANSAF